MTLGSGRRRSVLIFSTCAVKELYMSPIEYYDPDMIFVLVSNRKDPISKLERDIYQSVKNKIECNNLKEIEIDTHDYEAVLSTVLDIKKDVTSGTKDKIDIYINISSGTNEYAAAGMFASMLKPRAIAFNVFIEDSGLTDQEMEDIFIKKERTTSEPSMISYMDNMDPDDDMIRFLMILRDMLSVDRNTTDKRIIENMKSAGCWTYSEGRKECSNKTPLPQKEKMYLQRHFKDIAKGFGLLDTDSHGKLVITKKGEAYISVYGEEPHMAMSECCMCSNAISENSRSSDLYISPRRSHARSTKNEIEFERNGKTYRFSLSMKQ